jgi:cytochrome d ubiquinol oxidase subunit II
MAQYPFLVPPDLTVERAAAPETTLRLVLIVLAAGSVVLVPSLWYLFRIFKTVPADPGVRGT